MKIQALLSLLILSVLITSCSSDQTESKEVIRLSADTTTDVIDPTDTTVTNMLQGNLSFTQLSTYPNKVILTGMAEQRLLPIYKKNSKTSPDNNASRSSYYYEDYSDEFHHFMPGIDLLSGFNLVNVAHYDFKTEKVKLLFNNAVLVKSLYYPSFEQDSLNKKPINRNYFLISAYNEDTNKDTLLTKTDLRRLFYFNATATEQIQIIPSDYSVVRSQYDSMNDVMYIFARHDSNKNGKSEKDESLHVFWISLARPGVAKRMY